MNKKQIMAIVLLITISITVFMFWYYPKLNVTSKEMYILVNQVGYLVNMPKIAIIETNYDISNKIVKLVNADSGEAVSINIGGDLGEGYNFEHHFLVNFTDISTEGRFYLEIDDVRSPIFNISNNIYENVFVDAFNFFQLNHCGESIYHNICHTDDGVIANGPHKGLHVNMTGGWHDAGDYLKFTSTTAKTLLLLLETIQFGVTYSESKTYIESEINWGLSWLEKTWLEDLNELVYMVGNETDHEQGIRLPENDSLHNRPVYVCNPDKGANVAGLVSATLSLATILNNSGLIDVTSEMNYTKVATELYEFGKSHQGIQETGLGDWIVYPDWGWQDDMALAAILLYELTENETYYNEAISYFNEFINTSDVHYTISNLLAAYHLSKEGYSNAFDEIRYDLLWNMDIMKRDPLFWPWPEYYWGSLYTYLILAFTGVLYENATGRNDFSIFALNALDYIFGRNQWSICFVTRYGTRYPHHLHHQILYLKKLDLAGIMVEGGVSKKFLQEEGIDILPASEDPYAAFQSDKAIYQDVYWNYLTNEPTIRSQALFIFILNLFTK
ncbi:MAG: glycoside hydrolase family 9 protein [Candidatus Asgardarchaeia archaeon]